MKSQSIYLKKELQNDNVYVKSELVSLSKVTGLKTRKGLEQALISESEIVNIVSNQYGHLPNEKFFADVEVKLIDAGLNYKTRSINRDNRSFAVDYILDDENFVVKVKNDKDNIVPMLRFTNSYDGSCKTSGHFGFFREVCSNGLHVAESFVGFSVKHKGNIAEVVLPEIGLLVEKFMSNEYYDLSRKFEVLAERPIKDLEGFVKLTADKLKLFTYESSEKNPLPSLNARTVLDTIRREANLLDEKPNLWLGYNAFNELLHGKLKKTFENQKQLDNKIFNSIMEYN